MAKSIYEVLATLETETSVPAVKDEKGNELRPNFGSVNHTLPSEVFPSVEQFEIEGELLAWAKDLGITHFALQKAVQAILIDARAGFKAMPKKSDLESGVRWSPEYGQKNLDENLKWSMVKRPSSGDKESVKKQATYDASMAVARAMKATKGINAKMLLDTLTTSCGAEMAKEIIDSLE